MPYLEITEVVPNKDYQQDSRFLYAVVPYNHLVNYYIEYS